MTEKKGLLLVVSGPSGVGKGTVCKKLLERGGQMKLSVSATTRSMRKGEVEGQSYYFKTHEEFERMIAAGEFLEYVRLFNSNYYGTPRGPVEAEMAKGYDIMLSLHTNACNTESVNRRVVIYPISGKAKDLADKIGSALQSCMNLQKYQIYSKTGSSGDYYGVIRGAASVGVPCLIIEHTFHTNNTMAKWLLSDVNLKKVAQCVADTVAKYYGYSKKEDEIDMTKEELIKLIDERIKVVVEGANTQPSSWAKNEMEEAKAMGITDGSRPQGFAKRQEVVAMVLRAIKK